MQCEGWEGPCDSQDAERVRMNTAYQDNEKNYRNLCPFCKKACNDYWDEEWRELNNDIMLGIRDGNLIK